MLARLATNPRRLEWLAAGLLSLIWLIVYLTTVSPTVNFIDSGELITAAYEPGIAHPPGYPLYVLMGYVATHVLWGDIAWRLNVLSAFFGALAVGALFLLIFELSAYLLDLPRTKPRRNAAPVRQSKRSTGPPIHKKTDKAVRANSRPSHVNQTSAVAQVTDASGRTWLLLASAAGGASLLGASASFWSRTAQAKMYTLHFFILFALFLLALKCRQSYERSDKVSIRRWFIALAATLGLGLANHQMTFLAGIPVAIFLLGGTGFTPRFRAYLRQWPWALVAFVLPLLLYFYMLLRSSQDPIMNWGSPNNAGDFWRQITDWQFRPYLLGDLAGNFHENGPRILAYAGSQWGFLSLLVFLAGFFGAALLWRSRLIVFASTVTFAVITLIFCLAYGISELEPYIVPFYAMFVLWVGLLPANWLVIASNMAPDTTKLPPFLVKPWGRPVWVSVLVIGVGALVSAIVVYPKENFSNNRLAEQFALNVFNQLPQNSILITDYWDFYAPTYYEQLIQNVRPDLTLIDKSLLRYPFFTQQLRQRFPWLIQKSQDVVSTFTTEQRKWVDGAPFDSQLLNNSYFGLMTSFFERNQADHPAFLLTLDNCTPNVVQSCESNQIAPDWTRQSYGLVTRLLPSKPSPTELPPVPDYKLDGIISNPVPLDDAARANTQLYVNAYKQLSIAYGIANQPDKAQQLDQMAAQIASSLAAR